MQNKKIAFIRGRNQIKRVIAKFGGKIIFYPLDFSAKSDLSKRNIPYETFGRELYEKAEKSTRQYTLDCLDELSEKVKANYSENSLEKKYFTIAKNTLAELIFYTTLHKTIITDTLNRHKAANIIINCPKNPLLQTDIQRMIILVAKNNAKKIDIIKVSGFTLFKEKIIGFLVSSRFNFVDFVLSILRGYLPWLLKIIWKIKYYHHKPKEVITENKNRKKIVILSGRYTEYLKSMSAVIKNLASAHSVKSISFNDLFNKIYRTLKKSGISFETQESYLNQQELILCKPDYENARKNLVKELEEIVKRKDWLSWDILSFILEKLSAKAVFRDIPLYHVLISTIIKKEKPDLLILPDDTDTCSRTSLLTAQQEKVKTLLTPLIFPKPLLKDTPLWSTKLTTGTYQQDYDLNNGIAKERLKVTGNPKFDNLFKKTAFLAKKDICKALSIPADKPIFLFTLQAFNDNDGIIQLLSETMQKLKDSYLLIRPHPLQSNLVFKYIVKRLKTKNLIVTKSFDLYDIINIVDLVISVTSLSTLEAILLNKPVILLEPCIKNYLTISEIVNLAEYADNNETLYKKIKEIICGPEDKKQLTAERIKLSLRLVSSGESVPRIIKAINSLL